MKQGSNDQRAAQVLNEFVHESRILVSMAAESMREPVVILRIDGEDLKEFLDGPHFEPEAISVFSRPESAELSLRDLFKLALEQLTVEHGMPPSSDSWVFRNIVEPALHSFSDDHLDQHTSQERFMEEFKNLMDRITVRLKEHPIIVAHSENAFDGSKVRRLLSNKIELNKLLEMVWRDLPKDQNEEASTTDHLRVVLDWVAKSTDLPPYGTVNQVDEIMNEVLRMVNGNIKNAMHYEQFKQIMIEILGSLQSRLEENPIFVSSNSVVYQSIASPSADLPSSPSSSMSA